MNMQVIITWCNNIPAQPPMYSLTMQPKFLSQQLVKEQVDFLKYSRTPATRTLKGDEKRFELSGVRVIRVRVTGVLL